MKHPASLMSVLSMSLLLAAIGVASAEENPRTPEAQAAPPAQVTATPAPASTEIDDATLDRFADAFVEVRAIQQEFTRKVAAAADPSEAQDLETQAQARMLQSVRDSGLNVDQFNQIASAMQTDTSLQARVSERIDEHPGG